ncbi:hypothetical protein ACRALDRAFT_1067752 [Sodiomyces alcalophilus JCM 7366]|uniref:uncharacterized protein n=1 Tax=Sodiomyces alcalophilus JCM 7366 TaxID=591952 RepID=UPI0039B446C4
MGLVPLEDMIRSIPSSEDWETGMESHLADDEQDQDIAPKTPQREEGAVHTGKPARRPSLEEIYKFTTEQWLDDNEEPDGWYPINGSDSDSLSDPLDAVDTGQPARRPSLEEIYKFTTEQWLDDNEEPDGWYPINGSGSFSNPFGAAAYFSANYQGRVARHRACQPQAARGAVYSLNTRDWADYGSALVDYVAEAETNPTVPGCTAGQFHAQNWTFGASAFTAYAAMRGSGMETGNPLQTWMAVKGMERHDHDHDHQQQGAKDKADGFKFGQLRSFTTELGESKDFWWVLILGQSPRLMRREDVEQLTSRAEEEYDISDDEGSPPSGRISPCTFRVLAEGCKRWEDSPAKDHKVEMPPGTRRLRPETPPPGDVPKYRRDRLCRKSTLQRDVEDGDCISPIYSVTENPSIVYTPPGQFNAFAMRNWQDGMYDRMDPLGAQRLREFQFTNSAAPEITRPDHPAPVPPPSNTAPNSDDRPYTAAEVQAALFSPQARPLGDQGTAPEHAVAVIQVHWQWAAQMRDAAAQQAQRNQEARQRIASLRAELRDMRLCVDHVLQAREARRIELRNRRILRQVSAHLREIRGEAQRRREQLCLSLDEAAQLECEEQVLAADVRTEIARSGLPDAEAVRAEAGREFLERLMGLRDM